MKANKKLFTDKEIEAIKIVRGILNKVEKKYDRWVDKNYDLEDEEFRKEETKLKNWIYQLFKEGKIDISAAGNAFIRTNKD